MKKYLVQSILLESTLVIILLNLAILLVSGCSVVKTKYGSDGFNTGHIYYRLPESKLKIVSNAKVAVYYKGKMLTASNQVIQQTFQVTLETIADNRSLLILNHKKNILMDDKLNFKINEKGLLETIDVTTEDKTPKIVETIANAPEAILDVKNSPVRSSNDIEVVIKEYSSTFYLKVSEIKDSIKNDWTIKIPNEKGGDNVEPVDASFYVKFRMTEKEKEAQKVKSEMSDAEKSTADDAKKQANEALKAKTYSGVLTRPIITSVLEITPVNNSTFKTNLIIPHVDLTSQFQVPLKRKAFVKSKSDLIFKDGLINSNNLDSPSSVEGFISIPVNIAKAIVSIPAQIVSFKYDNTVRQKSLESEKLLLESEIQKNEIFKLNYSNELNKVISTIKQEEINRDNEMKTFQYQIETKLIEAERLRIEAQKELENLKKEIQEKENEKKGK